MRHARNRRRGAIAVEFALTLPLVLFLLLATIVGALATFRYQQVAVLAREASRWASLHGAQYEKETGNPAATPEDVFNTAMLPFATAMSLEQLSYEVTWDESNMPLQVIDDVQTPKGNTVTVTVSYEFLHFIGSINLTSSSTAQIIY